MCPSYCLYSHWTTNTQNQGWIMRPDAPPASGSERRGMVFLQVSGHSLNRGVTGSVDIVLLVIVIVP